MRAYSGGVIVGEIDPPPSQTLEQWCRAEIDLACGKAVVVPSPNQLTTNAYLSARIAALTDVLYEIEKRQRDQAQR